MANKVKGVAANKLVRNLDFEVRLMLRKEARRSEAINKPCCDHTKREQEIRQHAMEYGAEWAISILASMIGANNAPLESGREFYITVKPSRAYKKLLEERAKQEA